ncbi:rhodanese-like domain-containing protein [Helicobacter baculiformis]|uniref:Rhodanese-like domain-containing protein n=1 Tax=Helicobacter baculiformis TaxID=427351 RepID=A0ABV7ZIN8_9HELI|nr:rhodanese-like domain-containing protein [Helicobacter baculiformis]
MSENDYAHHRVDLQDFNPKDWCIVDIRDAQSYEEAHLKDAIHLNDLEAIREFALAHPKHKILLQCRIGRSAAHYASLLHEAGLENVYFLKACVEDFETHGLEMVRA